MSQQVLPYSAKFLKIQCAAAVCGTVRDCDAAAATFYEGQGEGGWAGGGGRGNEGQGRRGRGRKAKQNSKYCMQYNILQCNYYSVVYCDYCGVLHPTPPPLV